MKNATQPSLFDGFNSSALTLGQEVEKAVAKLSLAEKDKSHGAVNTKLLIPDIKGKAHVVFEKGELYPHHNLYFITSDEWNIRALQAVLMSNLTRLFIATYSTKMRGGYLRFQAQYLRRLRLPKWQSVKESLRHELAEAARKRDPVACNEAVFSLYDLSSKERNALREKGE